MNIIPTPFLTLLACTLLGLLAGIITGVTPGIHVNLVSLLLVASAPLLLSHVPLLALASFIISMAVTHTFLDAIPSIFLGAPEAATALGVLPGHRYVLRGWGYQAVKLTLIGSLAGAILSTLLFPLFLLLTRYTYPLCRRVMGWLLLATSLFMILRDKERRWAAVTFLLSGSLGLLVLESHVKNPLYPLFTGLFGTSTLAYSLFQQTILPPQEIEERIKLRPVALKALFAGEASGFLTAMLPGVGAATAAVLSLQVVRDLGDHGYLILQGAINTVNFILSLATLLVLGKARNGAVLAVQHLVTITAPHILLFLAVTLIATGTATPLTLWLGKRFARFVTRISYPHLVATIILFLTLLTPLLSSWSGLLILATATAIGLLPPLTKTGRVHAMGSLLLPVMLYFL